MNIIHCHLNFILQEDVILFILNYAIGHCRTIGKESLYLKN